MVNVALTQTHRTIADPQDGLYVEEYFTEEIWMMQGAANLIYVAVAPELEGVSGKFFSDMKEVNPNKYASSPELGQKVMKWCEDFVAKKMNA